MAYGADELREQEIKNADNLTDLVNRWPVLWVNVSGLGDASVIEKIGHLLSLEDVLSVQQRPKVEAYDNYLFLVARIMFLSEALECGQISLFLAKDLVVTFQQRPGDCFDPVRDRIRKGQERIRQHGPDYLAYALLDAVVDSYFPVLEEYGERLESLEDEVVTATNAGYYRGHSPSQVRPADAQEGAVAVGGR